MLRLMLPQVLMLPLVLMLKLMLAQVLTLTREKRKINERQPPQRKVGPRYCFWGADFPDWSHRL